MHLVQQEICRESWRLNTMSRTKTRVLKANIFEIKNTTSTSTQSLLIMEKLTKHDKATLRQISTEKENYWIDKPRTLHPQELNQELRKTKTTLALNFSHLSIFLSMYLCICLSIYLSIYLSR